MTYKVSFTDDLGNTHELQQDFPSFDSASLFAAQCPYKTEVRPVDEEEHERHIHCFLYGRCECGALPDHFMGEPEDGEDR